MHFSRQEAFRICTIGSLIRRSGDERKKVEMRFAHMKVHHAFERVRLRGLTGARDEFHLGQLSRTSERSQTHAATDPRRANSHTA
jgi:hypothetical protein